MSLRAISPYHFPLGLGRHAGVAVNQGLGGLWKRVGDAVAEALAQTGSEGGGEGGVGGGGEE